MEEKNNRVEYSAKEYHLFVAALPLEEIEVLHSLFKIYGLQEVPTPEYYQGSKLGLVINLINQYDPIKKVSFLEFLDGVIVGLQKSKSQFTGDVFFVSGQNINNKVGTQTSSITSDICLNLDTEIVARAIEKGLIDDARLKPIYDAIYNKEKKSNKSRNKEVNDN